MNRLKSKISFEKNNIDFSLKRKGKAQKYSCKGNQLRLRNVKCYSYTQKQKSYITCKGRAVVCSKTRLKKIIYKVTATTSFKRKPDTVTGLRKTAYYCQKIGDKDYDFDSTEFSLHSNKGNTPCNLGDKATVTYITYTFKSKNEMNTYLEAHCGGGTIAGTPSDFNVHIVKSYDVPEGRKLHGWANKALCFVKRF